MPRELSPSSRAYSLVMICTCWSSIGTRYGWPRQGSLNKLWVIVSLGPSTCPRCRIWCRWCWALARTLWGRVFSSQHNTLLDSIETPQSSRDHWVKESSISQSHLISPHHSGKSWSSWDSISQEFWQGSAGWSQSGVRTKTPGRCSWWTSQGRSWRSCRTRCSGEPPSSLTFFWSLVCCS